MEHSPRLLPPKLPSGHVIIALIHANLYSGQPPLVHIKNVLLWKTAELGREKGRREKKKNRTKTKHQARALKRKTIVKNNGLT